MADFIWLTALRLLTALTVLIAPLPALWFCGHVDRWDWSLLGMPAASEHQQHVYQYWDKSLDTFTLAMACIIALQWKDPLVRRLAIATFAWRVAGVAIFMATGERAVLVAFPNVFEKLFFFYLIFRLLARQDLMLRGRADAVLVMVALTIPKVADEYFVHVATRPWQTVTLLPASYIDPGPRILGVGADHARTARAGYGRIVAPEPRLKSRAEARADGGPIGAGDRSCHGVSGEAGRARATQQSLVARGLADPAANCGSPIRACLCAPLQNLDDAVEHIHDIGRATHHYLPACISL